MILFCIELETIRAVRVVTLVTMCMLSFFLVQTIVLMLKTDLNN